MVRRVRPSAKRALEAAIKHHKRGELDKAATLYKNILKKNPGFADALHFDGVLKHQLGEPEKAIASIRKALRQVPEYPDALNNLGNILRETGRLDEALESYQRVLALVPGHVDTLVNLASIHVRLRQVEEAQACLDRAMVENSEHALVWRCQGNVFRESMKYADALSAYRKSAVLAPDEDVTRRQIAKVLLQLGRRKEAVGELAELLERHPDDAAIRHSLAAYGGSDIPDRASDEYVRQLFDGFSRSFDATLARLEYKAPQLVSDALACLASQVDKKLDILDIGCGTGLCGSLVKPLAAKMVGVDLSTGMLRKASGQNAYDELHEAELTAFMLESTSTYDAIICVDTFVYFGRLDEAFAAAGKILNAGGYLIFTVEHHSKDECGDDWRLQHHGRFSHVDNYLDRALSMAGFSVASFTPVVPRMEKGEPVAGILAVARMSE